MNDEQRSAFDERIHWINHVTDLARDGNLPAAWQAIEEVDDEHLRSMIFVLIVGCAGDQDELAARLSRLN